MRGGAAFEEDRARPPCTQLFAPNDNLAVSALPLIALPGISPRIVTGRKGRATAFAK